MLASARMKTMPQITYVYRGNGRVVGCTFEDEHVLDEHDKRIDSSIEPLASFFQRANSYSH